MGCGKSSVGRRLSKLLSCSFIDLDSAIEESAGRTIPEIFASDGEAAFRQMEYESLKQVLSIPERRQTEASSSYADEITEVLALGGGTVITPECAELVHQNTICIYLQASVDTLVSHLEGNSDGRPMLQGDLRSRIEDLMAQRSTTYEKTAHIIIGTDGRSLEDISNDLLDILKCRKQI